MGNVGWALLPVSENKDGQECPSYESFMNDGEAELSDSELRAGQHQRFDFTVWDASVGSQADFDFGGFFGRARRGDELLFDGGSLGALIAEQPNTFGGNRDDEPLRRRRRLILSHRRFRQRHLLVGITADDVCRREKKNDELKHDIDQRCDIKAQAQLSSASWNSHQFVSIEDDFV